jgi:hypothetical protein
MRCGDNTAKSSITLVKPEPPYFCETKKLMRKFSLKRKVMQKCKKQFFLVKKNNFDMVSSEIFDKKVSKN